MKLMIQAQDVASPHNYHNDICKCFFVAFYLIDDSAEILKQFNYLMASHMPEFS